MCLKGTLKSTVMSKKECRVAKSKPWSKLTNQGDLRGAIKAEKREAATPASAPKPKRQKTQVNIGGIDWAALLQSGMIQRHDPNAESRCVESLL
jgi:hypothetical protein